MLQWIEFYTKYRIEETVTYLRESNEEIEIFRFTVDWITLDRPVII